MGTINTIFRLLFLLFFCLPGNFYAQDSINHSNGEDDSKTIALPAETLSPRESNALAFETSLKLDTLAEDVYLSSAGNRPPGQPMVYRVDHQTEYLYDKPRTFEFLTNAPGDLVRYTRETLQWKNLPAITAILGVSAIMVYYDQPMLDETQRFGRSIGLKGTNNQKTYFTIAGLPIQLPHDTDSWLYFIGDGMTHISIAAGFLTFGLIKSDNRALHTASQLAEGMLTVGFTTQLLKHISGRQSPFVSTTPGGHWVLFPDQVDYHNRVPNFDAFPSGHLATSMMTVTVIAENYPEKKWIRPLGYTLMALLSFEMVNNGVHWVSDYPLAIAIGYGLGKIAVNRGRTEREVPAEFYGKRNWLDSVLVYPAIDGSGGLGLGLAYRF